MATITQLTEIISGRLTPSAKKLDSSVIDIKAGSKITASNDGLDVDLTGLTTSSELNSALANKVDKDGSKVLSDNNYTTAEKSKLASLESSKFLGVYVSLAALNSAHATASAGNYADVDEGVGVDVKRYIWDSTDSKFVLMQGAGGGGVDIVDALDSNDALKALSAKQGKVLNDNKQDKAINTATNTLSPTTVNSIPLYTLDNSGAYVLCEPDLYLKFGDYYVPAYSAGTLGVV